MKELDLKSTISLMNSIMEMEFELAGVVRYTHYLEKFAHTMIGQEELHNIEINKDVARFWLIGKIVNTILVN